MLSTCILTLSVLLASPTPARHTLVTLSIPYTDMAACQEGLRAVEDVVGPVSTGLQCTPTYPRGLFAPAERQSLAPPVCNDGDLESTWGKCIPLKRT